MNAMAAMDPLFSLDPNDHRGRELVTLRKLVQMEATGCCLMPVVHTTYFDRLLLLLQVSDLQKRYCQGLELGKRERKRKEEGGVAISPTCSAEIQYHCKVEEEGGE